MNYRHIFEICLWQTKEEFFYSKRTYALLIAIGLYIVSLMEPVLTFSSAVGIAASPYGFIHIFNDYICQTVIIIGVVFLHSSSPFKKESYYYLVYRSGRMGMEIGNILYIGVSSVFYLLLLILSSWLGLAGHITFQSGWGKIWGTLARNDMLPEYCPQFSVSDFIVGKYSTVTATLLTVSLELLCFIWLGLCVYLINKLSGRNLGGIAAAFFIFLDSMIYNSWTPWAYRFSPITLSHISTFSKENQYFGLSLPYAYLFFCTGIALMSVVILYSAAKEKDLNE